MTDPTCSIFPGSSATARCLRELAWEATPLGHPDRWDPALKTLAPIMLASNQPMFLVWGEQRTLLYNDGYAEILGQKHPQALGHDFLEVWHEIRADLAPIVAAAYRGEPAQMDDIPLWMERKGYREETHFAFFYAPVRDRSDAVAGFLCACTEITSQVLAERRLAESEARHRSVLANMGEAFALFDPDFTIVEVNGETARLVDIERSQLIGKCHWEVFPGTFDSEVGVMYRRVMAEQRADRLEYLHRFPDGRECWFQLRAFPVEGGIAVFFRDVTAQRALDSEAALAAERVQLALDAGAIVGTWVWTVPDNRFIADERFAASFDLDPEMCRTGLPLEAVAESVHAEDWPRVEVALAEVLARGGPYRCEYRVRQRGGAYRWIEANGRVELDDEGRPVRFPGVLLDIEDRRRVEAERDQAASLLKTFIEAVPGVVYAKDRDGRLLVGNRGTAELIGRPPEEFIGKTDREVLPDPVEGERVMAVDRQIMETGIAEQLEEWFRFPDGTPALWWSTKAPLRDANGNVVGLIGSSVDITDRKRAEDALRLSEQRAAIAMEVAQLGTWQWDVHAGTFTADERCRRMCGLPSGTAPLGMDEVRARVHPEDWPDVEEALARSLDRGGNGVYAEEFRWLHADGSIVWTSSRGVLHSSVSGDGAHERRTMLGSMLDVTERRQFVEALKEADRRKDDFLAMLAHELRNPLAPISTAAQMLRLSREQPTTVARASEIIGRQVGHLTRLVDDLLDVSRVTRGLVELDRAPVDVRSVVAAAVEQAKPLVQSRGHELRMALGAGQFTVEGDFHRLVQVVSNLLNNAAKYTPQGGVIEVRLGVDRGDDDGGDRDAPAVDGAGAASEGAASEGAASEGAASEGAAAGQVVVQVSDNGAGIPADLLPRVFDLFTQAERTPDRAQGGLGIGLALVRSMVQLHHGEIEARSAGLDQGSTFTIRLPRMADQAPVDRPVADSPSATTHRRVLIVDDNVDAAGTLAEMLQLLGHQVATAYDARSALVLAANGAAWDTFILDIGLPEMTGYELGSKIRKVPGLESAMLIALTGYGQAHDRAIAKAVGFDHHLVKPADVTRLVQILDRR